MAALDRLGDLERFLFRLRPEEAFRANRLWRLPLLGTHDYVLPRTIAERLGDPVGARPRARRRRAGARGRGHGYHADRRRAGHRPAVRARLLLAGDTAGGDGPGGARLGCDQRPRPAAPRRRARRHGRRLGAQLPARLRVRAPGGAADRRLPVRPALPGARGGRAPGGGREAAAVLEAAGRPDPDRRARRGGRTRGARSSGPHRRHLLPPLPRLDHPEHPTRGAGRRLARSVGARAPGAAR